MGSTQSAPSVSHHLRATIPLLGKDVTSLVVARSDVLDLADFSRCLRVCKLWHRLMNTDAAWTAQLRRYCDEQYSGRTRWPNYEVIPEYFSWHKQLALRLGSAVKNLKRAFTPESKFTLEQHQRLPIDTATPSFRHFFATKQMILEKRWDEYTGPGTLVMGRLMEGYFNAGRLVLGILYDLDGHQPVKVYQGFFVNGLRHGRGISYYRNGRKSYEGTFEYDRYSGIGTEYWRNGKPKYSGSFVRGLADGYGIGHFSQGVYEGNWLKGKQAGSGAWLWRNGARYIGQMNEGKRSGQGTQYWPCSSLCIQYEGEWSEDRPHGYVKKYFYSKGDTMTLEYEGMYVKGLAHGQGTLYWESTGTPKYIGLWKKGHFHGQGMEYDPSGTLLYTGNFVDGLYHGEGSTRDRVGKWLHGNPVDDAAALAMMEQYLDDTAGDDLDMFDH